MARTAVRRALGALSRWFVLWAALLPAAALAADPPPAAAEAPAAPPAARASDAEDGFGAFCAEWMQKLAGRERVNLEKARWERRDGQLVSEYTGYTSAPVRCDSRVKKAGKPGVGVLVYHELQLRKSGPDASRARKSEPEVVGQVEVTEVFRYDGARWSY
jgi:hypothetical protein